MSKKYQIYKNRELASPVLVPDERLAINWVYQNAAKDDLEFWHSFSQGEVMVMVFIYDKSFVMYEIKEAE